MNTDKQQEEISIEDRLIHISWLNEDRLFEIACIVDNEYRQYRYDRKHFVVKRSFQKINLSTDKCDWASFIGILYDGKQHVTKVKRLCDDTEGWQDIQPSTMERIYQWYNKTQNS